jgi:hypothetical protein
LVSALGEHQDVVVACRVVESWSPWADGGEAGRRVVRRLRRAAKRAREEAEGCWERVERKKGRRWMEEE